MVLNRIQRWANANGAINGPVGGFGALLGSILNAKINRIHAQFSGQHINHTLNRKGRHGRRGRAICRNLWPVYQDIETNRLHVLKVIAGKGGHRAKHRPHPWKSTTLVTQFGGRRRNLTIALGANLDINRCR